MLKSKEKLLMKPKDKIINTKILEVLFILLLSLTPLLWLKGNEVVLGHDAGFRLNPLEHIKNLLYSWNPINNFGADWSLFKGFLVAQVPETVFTSLTGSLSQGQKLSFIFWFFIMGISMYIFIKNFFPQKKFWIFRLFSSTFYMFNFFLLQAWFMAERAKFSLFAALPLGLLVLYKTLSKEYSLLKGMVLFSFIFFLLNGGGSPANYGAIILTYSLAFFYLTFTNFVRGGLREIFFSIKTAILFFVGFLFINAYWILPQVYLAKTGFGEKLAAVGGIEGVLAWEKTVGRSASFINLFRLQGMPNWYGGEHSYSSYFIENPLLIFLSFIPVTVIFLGLLYHRRFEENVRKDKLFYLILLIFLVGAVFTAGSRPPLGFVYIFLIKYVPGFAIFRTAFYKFAPAFWFTFIFLTGYYLNLFILRFVKKKVIFNTIGVLAITFILAYHFPYFVGDFFAWNKPFSTKVQVPKYVEEMSEYVNSFTEATSRILLLPPLDQGFQNDSYDWGFWSLDPLPRLAMNRSIVANDTDFPSIVSDIYKALEQDDEQSFLYLSGITGVNHVLWRDDVLYSDKETTSEELSFLENRLVNTSGASKAYESGEWRLYDISSAHYLPLFYTPAAITYSQSRPQAMPDLLEISDDVKRRSFVFSESLAGKRFGRIISFADEIFIPANCVACIPGEIERMVDALRMPDLRFLPDSKLYFLISHKEEQVFKKFEKSPTQRIDIDLSFANKRLVEVFHIIIRSEKDAWPEQLVAENIERYKSNMQDALNQTSLLPEDERNSRLIKILSYLEMQGRFLTSIDIRFDIFNRECFDDQSDFITSNIKSLQDNIWITPSEEYKRYYIKIDESALYNLRLVGQKTAFDKVLLDGKQIEKFENLSLEKGIHKIEVVYPSPINILTGDTSIISETIDLTSDQAKSFDLEDLDSKETYIISFDYRALGGPNPYFLISRGSEEDIIIRLSSDGNWHSLHHISTAAIGEEATIEFFLRGFRKDVTLDLENFRVSKFFIPKIFLSRKLDKKDLSVPEVSFEKISPTRYTAHIENASDPFILAFGERFDNGWRLYMEREKVFLSAFAEPIDETNHFQINGYANAWYVDKDGDFDISIVFWPQTLFSLGVMISAASFISFLLILNKVKKN